MDSVNILFLSDLHFTKKDPRHAKVLEECAQKYISALSMINEAWKPQIVAIAGDVGFSGAREDYNFFNEVFFNPLLKKLGIHADHVVMCPGNHDKDDSRIPVRDGTNAVRWLNTKEVESFEYKDMFYKGYRASCNAERFSLDRYAVAPFQNYIDFLKELGMPAFDTTGYDYAGTDGSEYLFGYRSIEGIDFYCYNSAWDCLHNDKKDKGNLRIGPVKCKTVTQGKAPITISMVHHPQDWLSIEAISSVLFRREIIANESDIAVHGHMHTANICQDEDCKVVFVQLPTWSSTDTDFRLWQSYIFKINLSDFSYFRMPIFWYKDNRQVYTAAADGQTEHQLRLPQKLELEDELTHTILEDLCKMLLNNLERYVANSSIESLQTILELLQVILERTVKLISDDLVYNKMLNFSIKTTTAMREGTIDDKLYDELKNDAEDLRDSLKPEIDYVLTRRMHYD